MIICERFAWQHMPHTAGAFTSTVLGRLPGIGIKLRDDNRSEAKWTAFADRAILLEGKEKVMNFRKLPDWAFANARAIGAQRGMTTLPQAAIDAMVHSDAPDRMLERYLEGGVDRFLRLEELEEDLSRLIYEFAGAVRLQFPTYSPPIRQAFLLTPEQVERMYWTNPLWTQTEIGIYGTLPILKHESWGPGADIYKKNREEERAIGDASAPVAPVLGGKKGKATKDAGPVHESIAHRTLTATGHYMVGVHSHGGLTHHGPFESQTHATDWMAKDKKHHPDVTHALLPVYHPDDYDEKDEKDDADADDSVAATAAA